MHTCMHAHTSTYIHTHMQKHTHTQTHTHTHADTQTHSLSHIHWFCHAPCPFVSLQSNEWTGKFSFRGQNLHTVSSVPNPYEQAITIIGKTLEVFDDDKL